MGVKVQRSLIVYAVLLFYLCTPVIDSMICADCAGNVPFQGKTTISHMKTLHTDVSYSRKGETKSETTADQDHKTICSICANVVMDAESSSVNPPAITAQSHDAQVFDVISDPHCPIDKPPQNCLV